MKVCAVLLAAGKSERFGQDKLWLDFGGKPLWLKSYETFRSCNCIDAVGLVAPANRVEEFKSFAPDALFVTAGGADRRESSRNGVLAVPETYDVVLIHDAARALVTPSLITSVAESAKINGAAFPGLPVTDTIKSGLEDQWVTPDRSQLVHVQTPQGARRDWLIRGFNESLNQVTDDMSMLRLLRD